MSRHRRRCGVLVSEFSPSSSAAPLRRAFQRRPPTSFPFPSGERGGRRRGGGGMETTSGKKRRSRDKGFARVAFTPRHQRNCMRGNKQNYKALAGPDYFSASSLPRFSFSHPFFSSPLSLSLPPRSISLWNLLLALLFLALLSPRLPGSRNARVRLTHTWHRPTRAHESTGCYISKLPRTPKNSILHLSRLVAGTYLTRLK